MSRVAGDRARTWARIYFALQATAGVAWWLTVFTVPWVREATLGALDPVVLAVLDIPLFVVASAVAALGLRPAVVVATGWTMLVTIGLAVYATVTGLAGWGVVAMIAASAGSLLAACLLLLGRVPTEWLVRGPFAFRPAPSRPGSARNVATTFGQIVVFWGVGLAAVPLVIAALEDRWQLTAPLSPPAEAVVTGAGVVLLVLASALGIWSAVTMSTLGDGTPLPSASTNRLVIAGPYRWVRNPMAVAGIAQGVAVGLVLSSWLVVVYALAGSLVWNYAIRPFEEADLEQRFGAAFTRYRAAVRCWLPRNPEPPPTPTAAPDTSR
ncbi:methyltransferase family protein [Herbiconiux gentiana]|uniref:methyltransferase family protein n=1 Tax=Herbiconiux gentiana TaxID=2970912 RepID=UPI0035C76AC7